MKTTLTALALTLCSTVAAATELPVLEGSAPSGVRITSDGTQMLVGSTKQNNVLTWKSFSVSEDAELSFDHHNYLNLVTGGTLSKLDGSIFAAGNLYIVNPAGITQGLNSSLQTLRLGLSTARLSNDAVASFESTGLLEASGQGSGRINLLGEIRADNLLIDGGQVVIRDVANLKDHSGDALNNRSYDKITLKSSKDRVDVGGSTDTNLVDYGFEGAGYVSHLGQTPVSSKEEFLKIKSTGEYFITNDLDLGELSSPLLSEVTDGFSGSLEGCMSRVSFSLNDTRADAGIFAGLFAKLTDAEVADLFLNAQLCLPKTQSATVGGLAGSISGSSLENVTAVTDVALSSKNLALTAGGLAGSILGINRLQNVTASMNADALIQDGTHTVGSLAGIISGTLKTSGLVGGWGTEYVTGSSYGDLKELSSQYAALSDDERTQFVSLNDGAFYAHTGFYDTFHVHNFTLDQDAGTPDYSALASEDTPFALSALMDIKRDTAQESEGKYVFKLGGGADDATERSYYFVNTLEDGTTTQTAVGRALVTVGGSDPAPVTPEPEVPDPVIPDPAVPDPETPADPGTSDTSDNDYGYPKFTAYGGFLDDDGDPDNEKSRILAKAKKVRAGLTLKAPALKDAVIATLHERNCEILAAVAQRANTRLAANSKAEDQESAGKA